MERLDVTNMSCPSPDLSAYLDGELSSHDELKLEEHLAGCRVCTEDLNLQKGFLNALEFSLDDDQSIELPAGFTKTVVTNAESRVTGLRHPHERRNAAFICVALIIFSAVALGSNANATLTAVATIAEKSFAVAMSIGHFVYDMALGSTLVFRSLASAFVFDSAAAFVFVLALFVLSLYVFSRLLGGFRRT